MKRINDHIKAQALFSAYLDNQTTADEKKFIERHLTVCDQDCRAVLAMTRSMISATRSLPPVKAPRSFVLPQSMARQPGRSIFDWYPALRLATAIAVTALVLVFAGDVLSPRSLAQIANIPAAATAPKLSVAAAPTTAPAENAAPAAPLAVPAPQSTAPILPTPTTTASLTGAAGLAPVGRSAMTLTDQSITMTLVPSVAIAFAQPPTAESTAKAAPNIAATTEPASQAAGTNDQQSRPSGPATDPLRVIEFILGALVIVLAATTLIVRQRARN